jgi:uncharacterized membrane protein YphA (DoxX/SURF4 family)
MTLAAKIRRAPLRIVTGAFILTSGIGKLKADEETAKMLHGMGSGAYPALQKLQPTQFAKTLAISETALGAALLLPIVPAGLAGLALTGFAGSLLGMWWKTPGMHEEGSVKPTVQGTAVAKDVWMLGIGASLLLDNTLTDSRALGFETRANARATVKAEAKAARKTAQKATKLAKSALPG